MSLALTLSDQLGVAGSLLLLVAPARDQLLRFQIFVLKRRPVRIKGDMKEMISTVAQAREYRRNRWSAWDSLTMALGALLLAASYLVGDPAAAALCS